MERLTTHDELKQPWVIPANERTWRSIYDRLAAYEDTGLTPTEITAAEDRRHNCKIECLLREYNKLCAAIENEDGIVTPEDIEHIRALREAEAEGRLVVLPCKVGDTVYTLFEADDGWNISEDRIVEVGIRGYFESNSPSCHPDRMDEFIPWSEIGKFVFLSREEAEAALNATPRNQAVERRNAF